MLALLRGCHLAGAVRLLSRHATPVAFSHIIVAGASGRAFLNAVNPSATGLFVFGHPTLGDWSKVPAQYKHPDGHVLHQFSGATPLDGGQPLTAAEFAALSTVELYVRGHVRRYVNGTARDGTLMLALDLTTTTLLDAIAPAAILWRSDGATPWATVAATYKRLDGKCRADVDKVQTTGLVQHVEPAPLPP